MKIDVGESLVYSYLRHVKNCYITQINWKPSGNWMPDPGKYDQVKTEFERIQKHKAFTEIFKTGLDHTLKQTEIDVLGLDQNNTIYAINVTFHELGINFGSKTDTRNRVIKNLLRAHLALSYYFPGQKHVLMFCSPKVSSATEEIIRHYFHILEMDFSSENTYFKYFSNDDFRELVLMETIERTHDEFDNNELFLRSFKLLTVYAEEIHEEIPEEDVRGELPKDEQPKPVMDEYGKDSPGEMVVNEETDNIPPDIVKNLPEEETGRKGEETEDENEEENKNDQSREVVVSKVDIEIQKVKTRVPKWFKRPEQNNSRILLTYLSLLEKSENISLQQLAAACSGIPKFMGNYAQMINIANKNHGKIFSGDADKITLWEPVKEFIIQEYIEYKKSFY